MRIHSYLVLTALAVLSAAEKAHAQDEYYVATDGNDQDNPGTIELPFATIQKAVDVATAGTTIYVRGGTYRHETGPSVARAIVIEGKSGTPENPIRLWAFPGEEVILDFSDMGYTGEGNLRGIWMEDADWWHIKGLHLVNVPAPPYQSIDGKTGNGFAARDVDNCTFELLRAHGNHGTGIRLYRSSSNNLFLNCDAYNNIDDEHYEQPGQNADGFAIAFMTPAGTGNVVRGCRAWWNGDDGIDLWEAEAAVTIEMSWFFWNGYYPGTTTPAGNGNGMKLGKNDDGPRHVLRHNLVFENRSKGIDDNYATGPQDWFNNTVFENGDSSFSNGIEGLAHRVRNNIRIGPANDFHDAVDDQYNSWNNPPGVFANRFDFLSVDSTGMDAPRAPDGSLPETDFLKLAPDSDLVDAGVDVGLPFLGEAPDLGAYEGICRSGFAECVGPPDDDCETDTQSDTDHCGGCGQPCSFDNAAAICRSGGCVFDGCLGDYADCNATESDGCETDTLTDTDHCGSCDAPCLAGQVCLTGDCVDECAAPLTDCGGSCVDLTNNLQHCGSCNNACAAASNADPACEAGLCRLICHADWGDCNQDIEDGCEADTQTDTDHCGDCDAPCLAGQACRTGDCVDECAAPLTDCGGSCVDLTNDPQHCGNCIHTCASASNAEPVCEASQCRLVCHAGWGDCNENIEDGCEEELNSDGECPADEIPDPDPGCSCRAGGTMTGVPWLSLLVLWMAVRVRRKERSHVTRHLVCWGFLVVLLVPGSAFGEEDTMAEQLIQRVRLKDFDVINDMKSADPGIVRLLEPLTRHEDRDVRELALFCLEQTGGKEARAAFVKALYDRDSQIRAMAAARFLQKHHAPDMVASLLKVVGSHRDSLVREHVALVIGKAGDINARPVLRKLRKLEKSRRVKKNILLALARLGDQKSQKDILRRLRSKKIATRLQALRDFEYMNDQRLVFHLLPLLEDERDAVNVAPAGHKGFVRMCDVAVEVVDALLDHPFSFQVGSIGRARKYSPEEISEARSLIGKRAGSE